MGSVKDRLLALGRRLSTLAQKHELDEAWSIRAELIGIACSRDIAALREQPEARGVVDEDDPKNWPERASDMKPLPWLRRMRKFHINYPETVAMIDEQIAALTAAQQPAPPSAPVGVEDATTVLVPLDALTKAATALTFADCYDEAAELLSFATTVTQQPAQAAPGWRLVPVEPTEAMREAILENRIADFFYYGDTSPQEKAAAAGEVWAATLAATPPGDDAAGGA